VPLLFEFGDKAEVKDRETLEQSLLALWEQQGRSQANSDEELSEEQKGTRRFQPFLTFDGNQIRAKNYVGFIQNGVDVIEIFPKVFRSISGAADNKHLMLRHIFYWFDFCRKWQFPFSNVTLDNFEIVDFPELIINLIATQLYEAVSSSPLSMYEPIEEALQTPRGSINFSRYVTNSLGRGNHQNIECDYEPFQFNNRLNKIIKYCSRLLLRQTKFVENQRLLQEITFILSDVDDSTFQAADLDSVRLNPFFTSYEKVIDSCRIVLNQQVYSSSTYDLQQWCLLFPMEYIFEDFLAGFLDVHFGVDWKIDYQKSDMFVSDLPRAFQMQHDIFLTSRSAPSRQIIVDAKYKVRDPNFKDDSTRKKGVSQADLYQMLTYAMKRGCTEVLLLYPNTSEDLKEPDFFRVETRLSDSPPIHVVAAEIPFWSMKAFGELSDRLSYQLRVLLEEKMVGDFA
jgi:5-methylcytosine-specific restriction enzyme subunit McrC